MVGIETIYLAMEVKIAYSMPGFLCYSEKREKKERKRERGGGDCGKRRDYRRDVQGYSSQEEYEPNRRRKMDLATCSRYICKNSIQTRIFGNKVLVNQLEVQSMAIQKRRIRRRSLGIVVHHPYFKLHRIETIFAMENKIREKKREERERKRGGDCDKERSVEQRGMQPWAQLTFLFESRNILPPCSTNSDGSDQEGDENDKSDKESEGDEE
ncbi:hypothetical protein H5410_003252 [Solanum commersonii]|uniref:Uncharacterized protein n=1 Tax=Solanum commersonii TaxID=4109 RepID=A0A9J6B547_SOLCO|nr:hypothetical protein H5410_003252 [Solanum commersonii]